MSKNKGARSVRRAINALTQQVESLKVRSSNGPAPAPRRSRRRRRRGGGNGAGGSAASGGNIPAAYASVPRNSRQRRNAAQIGNGGRIRLQRDELLCQAVTTADKTESVFQKALVPSPGLMPFLFRLAACYQRIRWLRAHISWRPSCGTSTNGIISYGVAYNNSRAVSSRELVTALTPCNDHPVWQNSGNAPLVIPGEMLMSRKWYSLNTNSSDTYDQQIGTFCVGMSHDSSGTGESRGEFWISYTVEMEGTNPG